MTFRRIVGVSALAITAAALLAFGLASAYYPMLAPARQIAGVVQSAGPLPAGRMNNGMREAASVQLANGNVVIAYVGRGGPLPPGPYGTLPNGPLSTRETVVLWERPRLQGPPSYEVIARR